VITNDGRSLTGLLAEDTPQRIVLKMQGGKLETIARSDIESITLSKLSLMPEGLEKQLTQTELVDLFEYLLLDKPPGDPAARRLPGAPKR
jgi:putative heme-binding domain-containing protein